MEGCQVLAEQQPRWGKTRWLLCDWWKEQAQLKKRTKKYLALDDDEYNA